MLLVESIANSLHFELISTMLDITEPSGIDNILGLRPICCKESPISLCKRITSVACSLAFFLPFCHPVFTLHISIRCCNNMRNEFFLLRKIAVHGWPGGTNRTS